VPNSVPTPSETPPTTPYPAIAVLGAGAWGTALASVAVSAGRKVRLWARKPELAEAINKTATNPAYLADIPLPAGLTATADMAQALHHADAVLVVTPSRSIRQTCAAAAHHIHPDVPVAICAKGIEAATGRLMAQIAAEELGQRPVGVISGPTFARETALGHPTAATVAFPFTPADRLEPHNSPAARMAVSLSAPSFRAYVSDDLIGVEVGGAVKNVIAIACGMMAGAGFAENTRAALITRGLDEMARLAEALGGRRETVMGLSGVGDLTLTCGSQTSRNMALGFQLGQGQQRAACFDGQPVVVEGEVNAPSVTDLARKLRVEMPICETVRAVLHENADLRAAFTALWARSLKAEPSGMRLELDNPAEGFRQTP